MAGKNNIMYTVINVDTGRVRQLKGSYHLRKNFTVAELACSDGTDVVLYSSTTLDHAQAIRNRVGPLSVTSAFRTQSYNQKLHGSATNSQHLYGRALDLKRPRHMTLDQFYQVCEEECGYDSGIGYYSRSHGDFIHIDSRGRHARWRK